MRYITIILIIFNFIAARDNVAMIDFEANNVEESVAQALTEEVLTEMIKLDAYQVIERSKMRELIQEQNFQNSGCVNTACAVKLGNILGVKYIITGTVNLVGNLYSVNAKMILVENGVITKTASYKDRKIENLMEFGMKDVAVQLSDVVYKSEKIDEQIEVESEILIKNSDSDDGGWPWKFEENKHEKQKADKEEAKEDLEAKSKVGDRENWYFMFGYIGSTSSIADITYDLPGSTKTIGANIGFYWHYTPNLIAGFSIGTNTNTYEDQIGEINYLYQLSGISIIGWANKFGSGPFWRVDAGWNHAEIGYDIHDDPDASFDAEEQIGYGFLFGAGWSKDFSGKRRVLIGVYYNMSKTSPEVYITNPGEVNDHYISLAIECLW